MSTSRERFGMWMLCLIVIFPTVNCGYECPDAGWELWGDSCFIFSIPSADRTRYANGSGYQNAVSVCTGIGGHLLVLDSLEETRFVIGKVYSNADSYLWCTTQDGIKATCGGASGNYYNSASDKRGFWDWYSGYPRAQTSPKCVVLRVKEPPTIITSGCTISYSYVCEKPAVFDGSTTTEELPTTTRTTTEKDEPAGGGVQRSFIFAKETASRRYPSTCLINHVLSTRYAHSMARCASLCTRNPRCKSFSFFRGEGKCELNELAMEDAGDSNLVSVDDCVGYDLQ